MKHLFNKLQSEPTSKNHNLIDVTIEQIRQETRDIIYEECKRYLQELAKDWEIRKEQAESSARDLINLTKQSNIVSRGRKKKAKVPS